MSSEELDVSAYIDNVVIDAVIAASVEAAKQNDDIRNNYHGRSSMQPCSNIEHNGDKVHTASGIDDCLEMVSEEDKCEQVNAESECRMLNFDGLLCSSLGVETVTEMHDEKELLQFCPDTVGLLDELDQNTSATGYTSYAESALSLPDFNRLYDDDCTETESVLDSEPLSCDTDNVSLPLSSRIPYFEKCSTCDLISLPHTEIVGDAVTVSMLEEKSLIELMKEIREDLVGERNYPETDLGLGHLFEDATDNPSTNSLPTKTKSAKKRKKQQLRLKKLTTPNISSSSRHKFAQTFDELKRSPIEYEDHNLDPSITCPVCLDLYHLPSVCQPCGHMFCDLCLRRLTGLGTEGIPCPLCRAVISSCELNREFDENLLLNYPDVYTGRAMSERHSKYRHQLLPYTPPVPLGKRIMRQLIANRNHQSDLRWMSHDSFKFLLGCTVGMFLASLVMLYSRVTSINDTRDVNVVFLSVLLGATVTYLVFKFVKI